LFQVWHWVGLERVGSGVVFGDYKDSGISGRAGWDDHPCWYNEDGATLAP